MVIFHSYAKYYLAVILCQNSRTYELFANQESRKPPSFSPRESEKASSHHNYSCLEMGRCLGSLFHLIWHERTCVFSGIHKIFIYEHHWTSIPLILRVHNRGLGGDSLLSLSVDPHEGSRDTIKTPVLWHVSDASRLSQQKWSKIIYIYIFESPCLIDFTSNCLYFLYKFVNPMVNVQWGSTKEHPLPAPRPLR